MHFQGALAVELRMGFSFFLLKSPNLNPYSFVGFLRDADLNNSRVFFKSYKLLCSLCLTEIFKNKL